MYADRPTMAAREKLFTMRMSHDESARLDEVAKHHEMTAAQAVRLLVKREHDRMSAERRPSIAGPVVLAQEDPALFERAVKAHLTRCEAEGAVPTQPSSSLSTINRLGVIVLRNTHGELRRFRFKNNRLVHLAPKEA